ncbi:hypothetical protein [Aquibacillus kalidii]|uniref:hypothetical protein n=1 Tax=Aquibacillus kalidii TaxID=2762597 RepID=UPI0016480436|nr:hypothetical protein [Aquibacillus kalidii]
MSKHVQAYFRNENDAESAHAMLNKLNIKDLRIDVIPEDSKTMALIPAINGNISSSTYNGNGIFSTLGEDGELNDVADSKHFRQILEFYVDDGELDQALNTLAQHGGYVDKDATY